MIDEALRSLIAFVESASPVIWAAAQQEVAVQATIATRSLILAIVFWLLLFALGFVLIRKAWNDDDTEWGEVLAVVSILSFIVSIVCFFIAISEWNYITSLTMNPEYQAIKIISEFVTGVCD